MRLFSDRWCKLELGLAGCYASLVASHKVEDGLE